MQRYQTAFLVLVLSACGDSRDERPDATGDAATDLGSDARVDANPPEDLGVGDTGMGSDAMADAQTSDAQTSDASVVDGGADLGMDADLGADAGPLPEFADCDESRACEAGLRCEGFVESIARGKCVPESALPGEGMECSELDSCGEGLLCLGLGRGFGLCLPRWMRATFSEEANLAIPDEGEQVFRLTAYGLATVDMDVELELEFEHSSPSDLQMWLTNPDGNEVLVYDGAVRIDAPGRVRLEGALSGFSGDESVNGTWTLRIVDGSAGGTGNLIRWAITIASRFD